MPPHFSEGIRFTLGKEELPDAIRTLREQERVVPVATHNFHFARVIMLETCLVAPKNAVF